MDRRTANLEAEDIEEALRGDFEYAASLRAVVLEFGASEDWCVRLRGARQRVRAGGTEARRGDAGNAHADDTCGEESTWDHAMREMCVGARHEAVVRVRVVTFRRALLCFERDPFTSTFLRPLDASVERLPQSA